MINRMTTSPFAARPRPTVTRFLVGLNLTVFVAMAVAGVSALDPSGEALLPWGANFGPRTLSGEPWRLLTSTFLHFGVIHLAMNMWCLWALGTLAEPLLGGGAFLLLYLLSGLGGSVLSMLVHPMVISAGASGAVFGVAGALIPLLWLRGDGPKLSGPGNALGSVIGFVAYNLVYSLTRPNVDMAGHIGGLVVGLVLGFLFEPRAAGDEARLTFRSLAAALAVALIIGYGEHAARGLHRSVSALGRAQRDINAGAYDRAIAALDSVLAHDTAAGDAHRLLAIAYGSTSRWREAVGELDTAIARTPNDPSLFFERGNAHLELRDASPAIADYAAVIRLAPRVAVAYYNLGVAYLRRGDVDSARLEFAKAADMPGDEKVRRDAQHALIRLGRAPPPAVPGLSAAQELAGLRSRLAQARDAFDRGRYAPATVALRVVERDARSLAARYPDDMEVLQLVADSRGLLTRVRDACLAEQVVAGRRGEAPPTCP